MRYSIALVLLLGAAAAMTAGGLTAAASPQAAAAKTGVVYIPAKDAEAALTKPGTRLFDSGTYSIMFFRRTGPGESELHDAENDIFYIVDGAATFVTGGTMEGARTTAPGEVRGKGIRDGQVHQLSKGDIITIPKGVPHWYREVQGSVTYFIVKVR